MNKASFIFVLHSHLPYVRKKGKWPHGEEMVFEAIAETYIPLLNGLNDLLATGYHPRLTISLTPILLEQLADEYMKDEFVAYLQVRMKACSEDMVIYSTAKIIKDKVERQKHKALAKFYLDFYKTALDSFTETYNRDIVGAFKALQEKEVLDIITSSATHAYLPLYQDQDTINEQLKVGIQTYERYLGTKPRGIWLPECGYRPAKSGQEGFESLLQKHAIQYFFTDSHVFSSSMHINKKEYVLHGPYDYKEIQYEEVTDSDHRVDKPTFRPYTVEKSKVAVFARDKLTSLQVWSGDFGYPGDFAYREFHAKDAISGLQYCRITSRSGLTEKELYEPVKAAERVIDHAKHFVHLVEERAKDVYAETGEYACIVSSYDTELFGHWWFEGVDWLMNVFKGFEESEIVQVSKADVYIKETPKLQKIAIPESSWGLGGQHHVWLNDETAWIWPIIEDLSNKVKTTKQDFPHAEGFEKDLLNQALRELLLLHASDWPFLISTVQAREYAIERFIEHKERCEKLLEFAYREEPLTEEEKLLVAEMIDSDNPFPELDYTTFGELLR